jgi:hypothetical protein
MRKRLRECAMFFINDLMPRKRKLFVKIVIDETLLQEDSMSGCCLPEDDAVNGKHYIFTINIEKDLTWIDTLSILAHELTHVKQFSSGELRYDPKTYDMSIWQGVRYDDKKIPYPQQPWEIDAVANEKRLLKKLLETDIWT